MGDCEDLYLVKTSPIVDNGLDNRIVAAYRKAVQDFPPAKGELWNIILAMNDDLHRRLMNDDQIPVDLSDPCQGEIAYGFDDNTKSLALLRKNHMQDFVGAARQYEANFRRLCQALGLKRVFNPEAVGRTEHNEDLNDRDMNELLLSMDNYFGVEIHFPNPFRGENGFPSGRGIVTDRAIQALYQAARLRQLSGLYGNQIVEIGAGFGRTAYFAYKFGLTDYVIVDLPLTNAAQASFLGRVLGSDKVCLYGEPYSAGQIRIIPGAYLHQIGFSCDLVLNVDSLTEMAREDAELYADYAMTKAKLLYSINHEANTDIVSQLAPLNGRCQSRTPAWLRDGYVEELYLSPRIKRGVSRFNPATLFGRYSKV